jgi:RNA polymerase sigma factor (sigma-70 family)
METEKITRGALIIGEASDELLLNLIANRDTDRALVNEAFTEFYNRHKRYVFLTAGKMANGLFDNDEKSDLAQETFIKAFEKAHTFKGNGSDDPTQERRWTRAWLGKIANNLIIDKIRKKKGIQLLSYDDEMLKPEAELKRAGANLPMSSERRLVQEAMGQLTEKEQQILWLAALNCSPGDKELRIPDSDLDELATTYNVSKASIRQTKKRAKDKVKNYLEAHLQ